MAEFSITVVAGKDLPLKFKRGAADARPIMRRVMNRNLFLLAANVRGRMARLFTRRTGGLENIVIEPVLEIGPGLEGKVGSPVVYARIHEFGGDVHAKNVANLTIPLRAMMTGRGVARGSARDVISYPGSYGFDATFFRNSILFGKQSGSATPLFKLQPSVHIPERPSWRPALEEIQPIFEVDMRRALTGLFNA